MKGLKFTLYGDRAYFKNHEQNSIYFSYEYIPKTQLIGLLGCVCGLDGWKEQDKHNGKLEFYEVFKKAKISIKPNSPDFISYKETINNTTGFANERTTANIERFILQDIRFDIIVLKDNIKEDYYNKLKGLLLKGESIYRIYLGNNNYPAFIKDVEEIELDRIKDNDDLIINSIVKMEDIEEIYEEHREFEEHFNKQLYIPLDYDSNLCHDVKKVVYCNNYIRVSNTDNIYEYNNKLYYFL